MPVSTPDFTLTLSAQAVSVPRGQSSTVGVQASDSNGFNGTINLSCSGLPAGVTCAFNPASLDPSGMSTLTVTAATMVNPYGTPMGMGMMGSLLAGFGLVGMLVPPRRKSAVNSTRSLWLGRLSGMVLLVGLMATAMGCGYTSKSSTPTTVGTKNVMVTGASGTLVHSVPFSLTVM
jgi:hypothetical protein